MTEMTTETPGRRERKKQATRKEIRRAALRLALEHGIEHLTVEQITEAADVSPRTFFNYFSCKEDALVADNQDTVSGLRGAITARPASEPALPALRAAFADSEFLSMAEEQRRDMLDHHRLVKENPALMPRQLAKYAALEQAVAAAMAERIGVDPDRDLRPAVLASLAATVIRVAMRRWATDETASLEKLFNDVFDLLEHELRAATVPTHRNENGGTL